MKNLMEYDEWSKNILFDMAFARKVASKLNREIITYLDSGSYGSAYRIDSYQVMKITTDKNEAQTANTLVGKNNKYIVNYFHVYELKSNVIETPIYLLIMEYLISLKDNLSYLTLRKFLDFFAFNYKYKEEFFIHNNFNNKYLEHFIEDYFNQCKDDCLERSEIENNIEKLKKIAIETKQYNIYPVDVHSGNLGFRVVDGDLIYFDLGNNKNYIETEIKKIQI